MSIKAQVIMLNDFPEFVFIGSESAARKKMKEFQLHHYNTNKHRYENFDDYKNRIFWHIKETNYIIGDII